MMKFTGGSKDSENAVRRLVFLPTEAISFRISKTYLFVKSIRPLPNSMPIAQLNQSLLQQIRPGAALLPPPGYATHPERVIQFGTGVLLRGLPDYFIDKANRKGLFNGRIVVVKSTGQGETDAFTRQDGLYTLCVRGQEGGQRREYHQISSSISRVLQANSQWEEVLACAANPLMEIVISNTTEIGIVLVDEIPGAVPPVSFPGKLLAFLHRRFQMFKGDPRKGLIIIPTELIPENGEKLRSILMELASRQELSPAFRSWLVSANRFCNSLVDCIVPGALPAEAREAKAEELGYRDDLLIVTEIYRLWAIQAEDPQVADRCSFAAADERVVIAPDISPYRERKLRLLNGPHSFSCGLAMAAGFSFVREAMADEDFLRFLHTLMFEEIVPVLSAGGISVSSAESFAREVCDRFANPFIDHKWKDITLQYSAKMRMRNVPLLVQYFALRGQVPPGMALGFAGYLWFMKPGHEMPRDEQATRVASHWVAGDGEATVKAVLSDVNLWGEDLSQLPGLITAVKQQLDLLITNGGKAALRHFNAPAGAQVKKENETAGYTDSPGR